MDTINEVTTLHITFEDGTETDLPRWFTTQFDYFTNIIEDLGEEMVDDNGKDYKYLELDFAGGMGSDLAVLLTKPTLAFLKRFAYHIEFLGNDDLDELDELEDGYNDKADEPEIQTKDEWNKPDGYQSKIIMKYISDNRWNELFQIYAVTDYLGNAKICHAITDTIMKYISNNNLIDIKKIQDKFNVKSQFTPSQQDEILAKFDWRE